MEFPHLKDNDFPLFNNVDVYASETTFDYTRWVPETRVRLVNVQFDDSYANVVDFDTVEARNQAFDELDGHTKTLDKEFRIDPMGHIKIDIPFDTAQSYNYLYIDFQKAPVEGSVDPRISRYFFFINDTIQKAPNTTELKLALDVWTTYKPYVNISSVMLKRGHWGVANSAAPSTFLGDPLNHTRYLTAEDVYFQNGKRITHGEAFGMESTKLVAFILPYAAAKLRDLQPCEAGGGATPATFSDLAGQRWGEDYVVNGYVWHWGRTYEHMTALTPNAIPSANPYQPQLYVYGVQGDEAVAFFSALQAQNPNVLRDIKAVYVVESDRVTMTEAFEYNGVQVYSLVKKIADFPIELEPEDFNYPEEYAQLTKLYTSPYAHVEVTDGQGITHELKIQDLTQKTHLSIHTSLYMLKYFARIDYVGSDNVYTYDVHNWQTDWDSEGRQNLVNMGEFERLMFTNDIPTFQVSMSARQAGDMDRFYQNDGMRERAIATYQNGVRNANTAQKNGLDANATELANALRDNATTQTNAYASADTDNTNVHASTTTTRANTYATADTDVANTSRSMNTNVLNLGNTNSLLIGNYQRNRDMTRGTQTTMSNTYGLSMQNAYFGAAGESQSWTITDLSNSYNYFQVYKSWNASAQVTAAGYEGHVIAPIASQALGVIGDAAIGFAMGGAVGGAAGLAAGVSQTAGAYLTATTTFGASQEAIQINRDWDIRAAEAAAAFQTWSTNKRLGVDAENLTASMATNSTIANRNRDTGNDNAGASATTSKANADRSKNTTDANSDRAAATSKANADRSKSTADTNVNAAIATSNANINYTRNASVLNLQNNLRVDQIQRAYQYYQNNFDPALAITSEGGDSFKLDNEMPGYFMRVVTPNENDLRQMGDQMLRYGYVVNEYVEPTALQVMNKFSYWETGDVFAISQLAPNKAVTAVVNILQNGVTVWDNMDIVNGVSIYSNM